MKFVTKNGKQFVDREGRLIEVETLPTEARPSKVQRRRQQQAFIIIPDVWEQRLLKAKYLATYRVALHILRRDFETRGKSFSLLNVTLESVSRWQKRRALLELEGFGLIVLDRRQDKAPRITALHTDRKPT